MHLSKYIQEAISSGKHGLYGVKFPDRPNDQNVKEWLEYKGYPDLTKGGFPHTVSTSEEIHRIL